MIFLVVCDIFQYNFLYLTKNNLIFQVYLKMLILMKMQLEVLVYFYLQLLHKLIFFCLSFWKNQNINLFHLFFLKHHNQLLICKNLEFLHGNINHFSNHEKIIYKLLYFFFDIIVFFYKEWQLSNHYKHKVDYHKLNLL